MRQLPKALGLPSAAPGPATLKAGTSPVGRFFALLFMALFWNGIVSVFVREAYKSWLRRGPAGFAGWFDILFLVPFVACGLLLLGGTVYFALALANPRPSVRVNSACLALGETLVADWQIDGDCERVRRLRLSLVGCETATYRRGTDNHIATNVFLTLPLAEAANPMQIQRGQGRAVIPETTMHSFDAAHNKIAWTLQVRGEIDNWPDLSEDYPIVILPPGGAA